MSKFKKVLSIVLCFALLAGSFAFLGDLVAPKAVAAEEAVAGVKSFADLAAAYDQFVYVAADAYELEFEKIDDGTEEGKINYEKITKATLTDGKVKAGSWLEYRMYIKSDMWVGSNYPIFFYDKRFFDVRVITSTIAATTATYEANKETDLYNKDHPTTAGKGFWNNLTSAPCSGITVYTNGTCELDEIKDFDVNNYDQVKPNANGDTTINNDAFDMTSDIWYVNWFVKVQDEPTIDTTTVYSPASIWRNVERKVGTTLMGDSRRQADVAVNLTGGCPTETTTAPRRTTCKTLSTATVYNKVDLHLEDTYKTFTIDDGSGDLPPVEEEKLTVKFVENNGTEISSKEYVVDSDFPAADVPAAVANQYGWADVDTGVMVDMASFKVKELADYTVADDVIILKRVLTTDEFPITLDLAGGTAEGATNGKVVVNATMGSEVVLADVVTPERVGYKFSAWEPATITIDNINGASAKATWTQKNYNIKFYIDQAAAEAGTETFSEVTVKYGQPLQLDRDMVTEKLHYADAENNVMVFDGWMKVVEVSDTGEIIKAEKATTNTWNLGNYNADEDAVYFASWAYSTINIMVKNLKYTGAEGENMWLNVATKYAEGGALTLAELTEFVNTLDLEEEFGFGVTLEFFGAGSSGEGLKADNRYKNDIAFEKGKNIDVYVYADANVEVVWQKPVIDAETGKMTEDIEETVSIATISAVASEYPIVIKSKAPEGADALSGHKFVKWVDADGEDVMYDARDGITATLSEDKLVYTGVFEETLYTIKFNVGNADGKSDIKTVEGTFAVGDEINFAEVVILDANGLETQLPVKDKENSEQVGGTQENGGYFNANGYQFNGWKIGSGVNARDFEPDETLALTVENLAKYANSAGEIVIRGSWTALEYELVFKYRTGFDENDQPVYAEALKVNVRTGDPIAAYKTEAEAIVKANLPDGTTFGRWSNASITSMQPYGMEIYAQYNDEMIDVYIDYNNSTTENPVKLEDSMIEDSFRTAIYGYDVEVPQFGERYSLSEDIRRMNITKRPCNTVDCDHTQCLDNFECIGWKIYHVAAGEDPYTAQWKEGVNDDGSTIAKTTIIYQAQWKAHRDFFFRIYNTDHQISRALGKDFKMYYWNSRIISDRENAAPINHLPEGLIVLFFLIEFENFDWNGFFDINMWNNVTLKFEAYGINKSFFEPDGFANLMKMLFDFILKEIGIEVE